MARKPPSAVFSPLASWSRKPAASKTPRVTGTKKSADKKAKPATIDPIEAQFGNDMAWLDPQFQQDPNLLGDAAGSDVYADPALVAQQQQALNALFGIAEDGGATAQERARRAGARADSENWLRGQREADMQNLAERGMSGSGAELLALGTDRQAAAQRNSAADLETDAWLEQRALDATMGAGSLAGEMRDTGFNEGRARADSADQFAVLNQQSINSAEAANKEFQQQAWNDMLRRRNDWDTNKLNQGLGTAGALLESDAGQNQAGYSYAGGVAESSANSANRGKDVYNNYLAPGAVDAKQEQRDSDNLAAQALGTDLFKAGESVGNTVAGGMNGGGGAVGGGSGGFGSFGGGGGKPAFDEEDVFG